MYRTFSENVSLWCVSCVLPPWISPWSWLSSVFSLGTGHIWGHISWRQQHVEASQKTIYDFLKSRSLKILLCSGLTTSLLERLLALVFTPYMMQHKISLVCKSRTTLCNTGSWQPIQILWFMIPTQRTCQVLHFLTWCVVVALAIIMDNLL